ncbi:MAG: hypothetical protein ACM3YE_00255 [Bacteroidota bacterium]
MRQSCAGASRERGSEGLSFEAVKPDYDFRKVSRKPVHHKIEGENFSDSPKWI